MQLLLSTIGAVFLISTVSVAIGWVETGSLGGLFFEPPIDQIRSPFWESVLPGVAMILGVYCGCVHSQLRDASSHINVIKELGKAGRRSDLWRALFASPVLFLAVYSSLEQQPGFVLALLFSFENGFFCDKVLER